MFELGQEVRRQTARENEQPKDQVEANGEAGDPEFEAEFQKLLGSRLQGNRPIHMQFCFGPGGANPYIAKHIPGESNFGSGMNEVAFIIRTSAGKANP